MLQLLEDFIPKPPAGAPHFNPHTPWQIFPLCLCGLATTHGAIHKSNNCITRELYFRRFQMSCCHAEQTMKSIKIYSSLKLTF